MSFKVVVKLILWIGAGYLLLVGALIMFQNQIIFHPSGQMIDSPDRLGLEWSEHYIETPDGVTIHGWLIGDASEQPVVIYSHGNAGNISGRIGIAETIANQGAAVFLYDYRGYGNSEGSPDEAGIYTDGIAVVNYLEEEAGIPPKRMIFYGRSLGGAVAARQAAEFDGRALVLDSSFINGKEIASDVYPFVPGFLVPIQFPVDEDLRTSRIDTVLVMHGSSDRIVNIRHGKRLYEIASETKNARFVELQGGHNDSFNTSRDLFAESWSTLIRDTDDS